MIPQMLFLDAVSADAKFGVLGALLGTLLGSVLTLLTSAIGKRGEIKIYTKSYKNSFEKPDLYGSYEDATSLSETNYFHFDLILEIYNSSHDVKLLRDIHVLFCENENQVFCFSPKDDASKVVISGSIPFYTEIQAFSLNPKEIVTLHLHDGFGPNDDIEKFSTVNNIRLVFRDDNNHQRIHLIENNYQLPF